MYPVPETTDEHIAFGKCQHIPPLEEIPAHFRDNWETEGVDPYIDAIRHWYFKCKPPHGFTARGIIVPFLAARALAAMLNCRSVDRQRKLAGAAFLMRQWFFIEGREDTLKP